MYVATDIDGNYLSQGKTLQQLKNNYGSMHFDFHLNVGHIKVFETKVTPMSKKNVLEQLAPKATLIN